MQAIEAIVKEAQQLFSLQHYHYTGDAELYTETSPTGRTSPIVTLTFHPPIAAVTEEGINPKGSVIVDYHAQQEHFISYLVVGERQDALHQLSLEQPVESAVEWMLERMDFQLDEYRIEWDEEERTIVCLRQFNGQTLYPTQALTMSYDEAGKIKRWNAQIEPLQVMHHSIQEDPTIGFVPPAIGDFVEAVLWPIAKKQIFQPAYLFPTLFVHVETGEILHPEETLTKKIFRQSIDLQQAKTIDLTLQEERFEEDVDWDQLDQIAEQRLADESVTQIIQQLPNWIYSMHSSKEVHWTLRSIEQIGSIIEILCLGKMTEFDKPKRLTIEVDAQTLQLVHYHLSTDLSSYLYEDFQTVPVPLETNKQEVIERMYTLLTTRPVLAFSPQHVNYQPYIELQMNVVLDALTGMRLSEH